MGTSLAVFCLLGILLFSRRLKFKGVAVSCCGAPIHEENPSHIQPWKTLLENVVWHLCEIVLFSFRMIVLFLNVPAWSLQTIDLEPKPAAIFCPVEGQAFGCVDSFSYANLMISCRLFVESPIVCLSPWRSKEWRFSEDSEKSVFLFVCSLLVSELHRPTSLRDTGGHQRCFKTFKQLQEMLCFLMTCQISWKCFLVSSCVSYTLERVILSLCIKKIWALGLSRLPFENFLGEKKLNPCTDSSE